MSARRHQDTRLAVARALIDAPGRSNRSIAAEIGCGHPLVGAVRKELVAEGRIQAQAFHKTKSGAVRATGATSAPSDGTLTEEIEAELRAVIIERGRAGDLTAAKFALEHWGSCKDSVPLGSGLAVAARALMNGRPQ
ncbi:MAG: hypothetical protein ACXVUL_10080 [Solirubrobacteraceae bacterium]